MITKLTHCDESDVVISFASQSFDHEHLYRAYRSVFEEADYLHGRHHVEVCVAVFKFHNNLTVVPEVFKAILRLSDRHISLDGKHHVVLFLFSSIQKGYLAATRTEKVLSTLLGAEQGTFMSCVLAQRSGKAPCKDVVKQLSYQIGLLQPGMIQSLG